VRQLERAREQRVYVGRRGTGEDGKPAAMAYVCWEERARRILARAASSHAWREQHAHAHARWGVAGVVVGVSRPTGLTETPS
jgi:hypothetical protein